MVGVSRVSAHRVGSSRVSTGRLGEGRVSGRQMLFGSWCGFAGQMEGNCHRLRSAGGVWHLKGRVQAGL